MEDIMDKGYTLYLTGFSGAGKSTLAEKTVKYLKSQGKAVQLIDGDIIRGSIGNMFGYTKEERLKASSIVRLLCKLLNDNGVITVAAVIGAYKEMRENNREQLENYHEIYLDCSIEECIRRDVKGLYKRALNGDEKHVIGIDEPYEVPKRPGLIIDTEKLSIEESMEMIKEFVNGL
jgi:adenylylsulfate kinase